LQITSFQRLVCLTGSGNFFNDMAEAVGELVRQHSLGVLK
jgi:hypothetical protein